VCEISGTSSLVTTALRNAAVPVGLFFAIALVLPAAASRWAAAGFLALAAAGFAVLVALAA
jgi:hypothetical protein